MIRFFFASFFLLACSCELRADWLQFRGPGGNAMLPEGGPGAALSEKSIAWKAALPGRGLSSPVVVGDKVFLTACSGPSQDRLHVFCFSAQDGSVLWERRLAATGRTMCHEKTCVAAPTPCSDGQFLYVFYSTNDLASFTLEGDLRWLRSVTGDYPNASNSLGMASSLAVADGAVIAMVENDSDSFTLGVDAKTGQNLWKKPRKKIANWTSPNFVKVGDSSAVVLLTDDGASLVNPLTGSELGKTKGGHTMVSAVARESLLLVPANGSRAYKVHVDQAPEELWHSAQLASGTGSPVLWKNSVLAVNNSGVLACGSLEDGATRWKLRLKGPCSGSAVVAEDILYIASEAGILHAVTLNEDAEPAEPATLALGQTILCTPAIVGTALYVRSDATLWKITR